MRLNASKQHEERFCALRGNFRHFPEILAETQVSGFDGMLIDLGVSSHQLDEPTRGFSFMNDGPLDLRMDQESGRTAADLLNTDSEEEIERVLREFGEEPQSRRIARAIVKARQQKQISTTAELAGIVAGAVGRKGKRHPATLTFQGLRIAVNDELAALHQFLEVAPRWLKPGGRLAGDFVSLSGGPDREADVSSSIDSVSWIAPSGPSHGRTLTSA